MKHAPLRCLTTLALAGVVCVVGIASPAMAQPQTPPPAKKDEAKPVKAAQPVTPAAPAQDKPANPPSAEPSKPADPSKPAPAKDGEKKNDKPAENAVSTYVLDHKVKTIDGKEADLSQYKGKVLVIVNVASQCGFTSQYEGLEDLYEANKGKGLVVLGFPANDFGRQEPGTDEEIKGFCESKFHTTFPMFSKVTVKGESKHPLYAQLAAQPKPIGGEPRWNFTKFVVDQKGNVVARFDAERAYVGTAKLEPGLLAKVSELLASGKK